MTDVPNVLPMRMLVAAGVDNPTWFGGRFSTGMCWASWSLHDEARDWRLLLTSGRANVVVAKALRTWCAQSGLPAMQAPR